ncbi:WYL domain-containing protein [Marinomonas sp. M1K-6]|uniref:WYL domain-containing protein n=1 Tax=Marinomonas profundi TaxID=2726122 RepID=A0A847R8I0_9GAMM|nr:WYL domain-containing protein [Marinomonas profundi]NLQ18783.1 WYL domain-containing protein [Marinomonas profundi]UDV02282.1 WYL domain-containing protein [Marinomonas profundi]
MEVVQRYWMIELLAFWEGQINTKPLMKSFGLTRQSVSPLFKQYQEATGNDFVYDNKRKAYQITDQFKPHYIDQTVDEYFDWLNYGKIPTFPNTAIESTQHRIEALARFVSPQVMRPLLKAVKDKTAVDCEYLSVSSSDPQGRLLYPHSFVKTAGRWHVRAYCDMRQHYLDFVLSRFQQVDYDGKTSEHTEQQDTLWSTQVMLVLAPDSRLTDKQKQVLENDYGMTDGQLNIITRAALVKYTLDDLQIKTKMLEANPQAQQLICVNYADIKQWLYD